MNEATDPGPRLDNEAPALTPRRGPDLLTLVAGVGSLGIAATAYSAASRGYPTWTAAGSSPRWHSSSACCW